MRQPQLEEPLESYSAQEMEDWVLVRTSADVGWRCENMKYRRNRWIRQLRTGTSHLVPGGRWLLVGCDDGSVTIYDLDASILLGRPLILPDGEDEPQPVRHIAIDIDAQKQSSNLTFTMVLLPCMQYRKPYHTGA
jgi:hypothetical protein